MYWIAGGIAVLMLGLFLVSRREEAGTGRDGILGVFDRMSTFLCRRVIFRGGMGRASPQVLQCLERLHPGEDKCKLSEEHYVRKLSMSLLLLLVGTLLGAGLHYSASSESVIQEGAIAREGILGETREVELRMRIGSTEEELPVSVSRQEWAAEEAERRISEFLAALEEQLPGENENLSAVRYPLSLPEMLEGYPFEVAWESLKPAVLSASDGAPGEVEEPEETTLSATVTYSGMEWEAEWTVTVLPPEYTEEELLRREILKLLRDSEAGSRQEERWVLPVEYNGKALEWSVRAEDNGYLLWGVCVLVAVMIYFLSDKDLGKQLEERKALMRRSYPEFIRKLALYIGAGMTVRGACNKMAEHYERGITQGMSAQPIYEELAYTCREIRSGIPEAEGYERFGRRTGLQEYIRVTTLLTQNLKKGSASLIPRLREEAENAGNEQILRCKRAGEEAQTKLLIPMMLMLLVVMIMIMVPAFSSVNL